MFSSIRSSHHCFVKILIVGQPTARQSYYKCIRLTFDPFLVAVSVSDRAPKLTESYYVSVNILFISMMVPTLMSRETTVEAQLCSSI